MERRLLLDIVISKRAAVLQLLAGKDEALLVRRYTFFVLNLLLHILNRVTRLHVQRNGLARERLHKDLHVYTSEGNEFRPLQLPVETTDAPLEKTGGAP